MDQSDIIDIRDAIVRAALEHVPFDGWVWDAVVRGAEEAGHSADVARAVFPDLIVDVLDHFADMADRAMLEVLRNLEPNDLRVRDRVYEAVMARFEFLSHHREAERLALRYWMVPSRKPRGLKILWRTCDRIWQWAGDESQDYNRYSKRGLLAGVIVATSLAWINDETDEMVVTRGFLRRRIENVLHIGGTIGKILGKIKR